MSTTPLSPAEERRDLIDSWTLRDALGSVIAVVGQICELREYDDAASAVSCQLFNELWPTEEDLNSAEGTFAGVRAISLASAMLSQLATAEAREFLLEESARLSALAADHVREATNV